jgi:protease I
VTALTSVQASSQAAVIDGQMVSARAWPDHPAWMREFIGILRVKSPA